MLGRGEERDGGRGGVGKRREEERDRGRGGGREGGEVLGKGEKRRGTEGGEVVGRGEERDGGREGVGLGEERGGRRGRRGGVGRGMEQGKEEGRERGKKGGRERRNKQTGEASHVYNLLFLAYRLLGGIVFTLESITNNHKTTQLFNHTRPSELKPLTIPELSQKFYTFISYLHFNCWHDKLHT